MRYALVARDDTHNTTDLEEVGVARVHLGRHVRLRARLAVAARNVVRHLRHARATIEIEIGIVPVASHTTTATTNT